VLDLNDNMGPNKGQERKKHNKTNLTRYEATEKKDKKRHYIEQGKSKGHMGISFVYLRAKKKKRLTKRGPTKKGRRERNTNRAGRNKRKPSKTEQGKVLVNTSYAESQCQA
jgi:hypothetical protein